MLEGLKNLFHYLVPRAANFVYGNPSGKIYLIGVTGTKGKSLTTELIFHILRGGGKKAALINSVNIRINDEMRKNNTGNTMPGRGAIHKILAEAVRSGCEYAVVEVASQGIIQYRHEALEWNMAIFLNIHPEHIEAHGGFENYKKAKLDFFRYAFKSPKKDKAFLINMDDEAADDFIRETGDNKTILFGGKFLEADYAAARVAARDIGISDDKIEKALADFKGLAGRMEYVKKEPYAVIIDYAHTPDSLTAVYNFVLSEMKNNKDNGEAGLVCVLGSAGGGRDKWKRPEMGRVAGKYCKKIIVTNEDPYDEDPMMIMEEVAGGVKSAGGEAILILDRQEAIDRAVAMAEAGDTVIITGKGSENSIHIAGGKKINWSDREAVEEAIKDRVN